MSEQEKGPRSPRDPKRDPVMLSILRWLSEDRTRTLPLPDDEAGIKILAQAIGKSEEYTSDLMAWVYGSQTDNDTLRILK
jgi:hypothetical protein